MDDQGDTGELDALPERFDPERRYKVRLSAPIVIGGVTLSPMHENILDGNFAEDNRSKIASARVHS